MYKLHSFFLSIPISPLFPSLIAFIAGIVWYFFGFSFYIPFFSWIFLAILVSYYAENVYYLKILLLGATFIIGNGLLKKKYNSHCSFSQCNNPKSLTIKIIDTEQKQNSFSKYLYHGSIKNIQCIDFQKTCYNKNILIYSPQDLNLVADDLIYIENPKLKIPDPSILNYYFLRENIYATINLKNNNQFTTTLHSKYSLRSFVFNQKNRILVELKQICNKKTFSLFSLLFLGNKSINKKELQKLRTWCKEWGISHYLARSGLHLVMIIYIWEMLFRYIPLSLIFKQILISFFTIVYLLLSWSSISFLRAFFTFLSYKFSIIFNRQTNSLHLITIITFLFLILNPINLFLLDFQLSFGITYLLAWIQQVHIAKSRYLFSTLE
ncbi:MAG: ComEC/Rec2 family competence protein [Candidatus Babeliales bacterium]